MTERFTNVYAVVLAAGASQRMGRPKQLLKWRQRFLLEHSLASACALLPGRVVVVLGAHAATVTAALDLEKVTPVYNRDWQEGIASSIRTGIDALPQTADAALLLLGDQPLIGPEQLRALLDAWQNEPGRIVASHYDDTVGVPAMFPAGYFEALLKLTGDRGAKQLLLAQRSALIEIPLQQAELDIDTIDDFNNLIAHQHLGVNV